MKNQVCHVGFTASDADRLRINKVMQFLEELGESTAHWRILDQDTMDIAIGHRDFLDESYQYEIVILHFLWRPNNFGVPLKYRGIPEFGASPLHSWVNWRARLLQTQARYIFPFGAWTEISGSFISLLSGYQLYGSSELNKMKLGPETESDFWCYARNDQAQPKESESLRHYIPNMGIQIK